MAIPAAVFQPFGQLTIPANTPTILGFNNWANVDPSADINSQSSNYFTKDGKLLASTSFSLELQALLDLDDFPGYTGDMILQAVFNPGPNSKSAQYIICSLKASQNDSTNRRIIMSNQVPNIREGDQIYLNFITSQDLDVTIPTDTQVFSAVSFRDCSQDDAATYWLCRSGLPPQMAVSKNKVTMMISTEVVNGVATFVTTQDGSPTGDSLFPNIIASSPMMCQSIANDSSLLAPSCFLMPFPNGNQALTAVFSDKTNGRWTATITATGR